MTPRERHQTLVTLIYAAVATSAAEIVAGAAVWLTVPRSGTGAATAVFLAVWAAVSIASIWPGARVYEAAGRRWDRAESKLPPCGGETGGPDGPSTERLHP